MNTHAPLTRSQLTNRYTALAAMIDTIPDTNPARAWLDLARDDDAVASSGAITEAGLHLSQIADDLYELGAVLETIPSATVAERIRLYRDRLTFCLTAFEEETER